MIAVRPSRVLALRPWVYLLALGLLLGFAFQGTRALWSTDEGRYVDGAIQMLDSGNFLVPAYSPDRINLSKPPMTNWVIAGAIAALGYNTWAVRTPYALAFVLTLMALYAMGTRLLPDRPWLAGLIYACAAAPFMSANVVNTDVLLTLFEAVAALGFVRLAFGDPTHPHRRDAVLMWSGLGLAFMTKGPPGLILLLAVIPFIGLRDGWRGLGQVFQPLGLAAFAVIGLTWYAALVIHDPRALHVFLYREVYERIFTAVLQRNPGPWGWATVYGPMLAIGLLPWWPAVLRNLWHPRTRWNPWPWLQAHPEKLFLLLWLLIPLVVFCLARSRLPLYILPLFLPFSLLLASGRHPANDLHKSVWRGLLVVWVLVLLAAKGGVAYAVHPQSDHRRAAGELAAIAAPATYDALIFVENADTAYQVQERTPWGLRLYLRKPVYGLAWYAPGHAGRLCRAVRANHAALLLLAIPTPRQAIDTIDRRCPVRTMVPLGTWRHHELEWIAPGHPSPGAA